MSRRTLLFIARVVGWLIVFLYVAGICASYWLELSAGVPPEHPVEDVVFLVGSGAFMVVGALLVAKRPTNVIGWIMATIALMVAIFPASGTYAAYMMATRGEPDALAWKDWAQLIARETSWGGQLVIRPSDELPSHLRDSRPDVWDHHLVADTARIRRELGYREIVSREEGLRRSLAWYAQEPPADPKTAANLVYEAEDAALVTIRASAVP